MSSYYKERRLFAVLPIYLSLHDVLEKEGKKFDENNISVTYLWIDSRVAVAD